VVVILADPELTTSTVSMEYFQELCTRNALSEIRRDATNRMLTTLVDQRLGQLVRWASVDLSSSAAAPAHLKTRYGTFVSIK
jgi:hypothetical protein